MVINYAKKTNNWNVERNLIVMEIKYTVEDKTNTEADKGTLFHCPKQRYFEKSEKVSVEFVCLKIENEVPLTRETIK